MKIEPNSDEDILHHWNTVNIEFLNIVDNAQGYPPSDYQVLVEGYLNLIRFLEKSIKERKLWN